MPTLLEQRAIDKPAGRVLRCKHCGHTWRARLEGVDPTSCPAHCRYEWKWNVDPQFIKRYKPIPQVKRK